MSNADAPAGPSRRSLIVLTVFTAGAFAILLALGFWQLERKAWKDDIVAKIEARAYGSPVAPPPEAAWSGFKRDALDYQRVTLAGTFRHGEEALVHGFVPQGRGTVLQGFFVMTPLRLDDGSLVLVNRGIVPTELAAPASRAQGQVEGRVTVTGLLRGPERRGYFTPPDTPERNEFFVRDPATIAGAKGLARVAPFYVDADSTPNPGGWPRGGGTELSIRNNHLEYALTWFGLALGLLGVYATFLVGALRRKTSDAPDRP